MRGGGGVSVLFRLPGVVVVANLVSRREGLGWGELSEWVRGRTGFSHETMFVTP